MYVQRDILLLADVFENFGDICIKTYELDSARFLSAPGLPWQTALKKTKVKLNLLTDIDVINGRKRCYKRNMSLYLSTCKS